MRILLVGDYLQDPRLGSTKVLVRLPGQFDAHLMQRTAGNNASSVRIVQRRRIATEGGS
jgi:hypothetical protein